MDTTAGPAPDDSALDAQVRAAQAEMVFARSEVSNWLGVPVGAMVCWVLWGTVDARTLAAWFGLKLGAAVLRVAIARRYRRADAGAAEVWHRAFLAALAFDGLVYGLLGTWLLPVHDIGLATTMVATLLGIASLGLVILSMSLAASLALTVPVLLPPLVYQILLGTPMNLYVAAGMAVFLGLVVVEGRKAAGHTSDMLRLRFRMDALAREREQALALARETGAVKDRFLATMSHEMRTPLNGILGVTRLLIDPPAGAPAQPQLLATLEKTGEHLLGVINDVLEYSKIDSGRVGVQRAPFDLTAVVEGAADVARIGADDKGLRLHLSLDRSPCWVQGDATRLRQILLNLTGNAVKFTDAGDVTLSVERDRAGFTVIDVSDTGQGVPADQHEAIFDAFHQIDSSDGRRHGGTGLGLTISRELARAMGGELRCVPGASVGATFRLGLPLPPAEAPAEPAAPVPDDARPLAGTVLLVEDNPVNALVAETMLERLGLTVRTVADGEAAIAACLAERPDLVLMDCQMPGMDGFEATRRWRAHEAGGRLPRLPIVALTANALEGDRERSLEAGMDDHLAKPYRDVDLRAMLQRHLRR